MKKLKKVLQSNYTYILLILILILYSLLLNSNYTKSKYLLNETSIYGYINSYYIDGDKLNIILIGKEKIICNYYFKSLNDKNKFIETYQLGDNINLYGEMSVPTNNTIPNLFNYKKYLKYEKVNYIFTVSKIKLESKNKKVFYKLKNYIFHKVRNKVDSPYLYTFILGNSKYIDNQVMDSYRINGISHLFAVSGMHVSLISLILMKLLGKFKYKDIVVIVFILLYMFLTNFSPSILRAGLLFILIEINKILKFNLNTKKIIILLLVILLIIDPYIIYKIGFQYSYVISFYLIYFNKLIVKQKNKVGKLFMVSFISFLASLPITINNFFQINLLSIIINVFMVPIISIIIFPLSILSLIVPFLDKIVLFIITIFEDISLFLSKIDWFILTMKKVDFIVLILYYLTITLVLYFGMKGSFKWIYILAIFGTIKV